MKTILLFTFSILFFNSSVQAAWCVYAQDPGNNFETKFQKCVGSSESTDQLKKGALKVDDFIQKFLSIDTIYCITWDGELNEELESVDIKSKKCKYPDRPGITIEVYPTS